MQFTDSMFTINSVHLLHAVSTMPNQTSSLPHKIGFHIVFLGYLKFISNVYLINVSLCEGIVEGGVRRWTGPIIDCSVMSESSRVVCVNRPSTDKTVKYLNSPYFELISFLRMLQSSLIASECKV